jgi:hypothetical protein
MGMDMLESYEDFGVRIDGVLEISDRYRLLALESFQHGENPSIAKFRLDKSIEFYMAYAASIDARDNGETRTVLEYRDEFIDIIFCEESPFWLCREQVAKVMNWKLDKSERDIERLEVLARACYPSEDEMKKFMDAMKTGTESQKENSDAAKTA